MVLGENCVDQAYIRFCPDKIEPLQPVDGHSNLWKCTVTLSENLIQYKYGLLEKTRDFTLPGWGRVEMLSKGPSCCEESDERKVESHAQFDVFQFAEEKSYLSETVPESVIFYLKWLLPFVKPLNIIEILTKISSLRFINLEIKHVKECVNWVVERALDYEVTDIQQLYLCIVLSHLNIFGSPLAFPNNGKTTDACDRLLQCLNTCIHEFGFLLSSKLERLEKIAIILVENSSYPGWLTIAAHFYPYLDITFFLDEKNTKKLNCTYDRKEYRKMVNALLSHIKKRQGKDQAAHQRLLHLVLDNAPNSAGLWEVFESIDYCLFFTSEKEKVDFFTQFYQDIWGNVGEQTNTSGEMLIKFDNIPKTIRCKLHGFLFSILFESCKTDEELNEQQEDIFVRLIISEKCMDEVLELLLELSKSFSRQHLLLKILDTELFARNWRKTERQQKVKICESWVMTRVTNTMRVSSLDGVDKIVAIYEALNAIMELSLNISNRMLVQEVSTNVVEKMLKEEKAITVLGAFPSVAERCVSIVQECYLSLVRKTLVKIPNVKKSRKLTKELFSGSR